jgi:uncharacterized protein
MRKVFYILIICTIFSFAAIPVFSLEVPAMSGPVNDLAGILSSSEKLELQDFLESVNTQTGVQLAVLTLPSLEGDSLESFSVKTAQQWELGQADEDNGVLLLVVMDDRSIRIEVGYGLEGLLTDMKSGLIIRKVIIPQFQNGNFGRGIIEGSRNIIGVATEDTDLTANSVKNPRKDSGAMIIPLIFFVWFILIIVLGRMGKLKGSRNFSGSRRPFTGSGGGFSGGSFGGFSSGGGGGGGFSGGGGSFGGGGASGRW